MPVNPLGPSVDGPYDPDPIGREIPVPTSQPETTEAVVKRGSSQRNLIVNFAPPQLDSQDTVLSPQSETYHSHSILSEAWPGGGTQILIDGEPIPNGFDSELSGVVSELIPDQVFDDATALARAIVDEMGALGLTISEFLEDRAGF